MYRRDKLNEIIQQASIMTRQDLSDKRILLRSCLNIPLSDNGQLGDISRLTDSLPTINYLAKNAKKLIIFAHLGRPNGRELKYSLEPVFKIIEQNLASFGISSDFITDIDSLSNSHAKASVIENIRFFDGEESDDESKREELIGKFASLADIYVNDAFPDYRESVSTYYIAQELPSYLGPEYIKEVKGLIKLSNPIKPFTAVIGGAKLSEKIDILNELGKTADKVLIGGAMAYTFLKSQGIKVGKSLIEPDKAEIAAQILNKFKDKILLPIDHMVSNEFSLTASYSATFTSDVNIPDNTYAIDIGPKTVNEYVSIIQTAKTLLINGPMGVSEWDKSKEGTKQILETVVDNTEAYKVMGGGDTISAANSLHIKGFDHVSDGGGAMLAFISNDRFPTLDIILDKFESD